MIAKWFSNIDFGKWTLNTSSGFVVLTAVMFIIDSLVPGHMTEVVFTDTSAGKIIIFGLAGIVSSSILGLMIDCIYHSFGRWYAGVFWGPLDYTKTWRKALMKNIGMTSLDFEWMYANSTGKLSDAEVEKDYLRFTEVAGSIGYSLALLLSPAAFMFLRLEYHQSYWLSLVVAILVAIGGLILLITNAASLRKYEARKTSVVMKDLRNSNIPVDIDEIEKECEDKILMRNIRLPISDKDNEKLNRQRKNKKFFQKRWSLKSLWFSGIIVVSALCVLLSNLAANHQLTEGEQMAGMSIIGASENATADAKGAPIIDITVSKATAALPDQAKSLVVVINDKIQKPVEIEQKVVDLIQLLNLPDSMKPKWQLTASLFSTAKISEGDRVYINILLSFRDAAGTSIKTSVISEGEWLFPIIVKDGDTQYILAQVHVKITATTPASSGEKGTSADKTGDSTSANKTAASKSQLEIHIV